VELITSFADGLQEHKNQHLGSEEPL
jgi:hypothetical protein